MRGALLFFSVLAGCSQPAGDALFPLEAGRQWTYRVATYIDEEQRTELDTLTLVNRGAEAFDGAPAWRRRSGDGNDYWLRSDASGIYRVASKNALDAAPKADADKRYVLRQPIAVGTEWQATTLPYVLERKNELPHALRSFVKPIDMRYRIDALGQTVEVPAGRFDGCVRVAGRAEIRLYVDTLFDWRQIPLDTIEWYCPRVGLVRLERKEPSPTKFMLGGTLTMELVSWR